LENRTDGGSAGGVALPRNATSKGGASSPNEPLPKRKKLPHEIPAWVQQGERHFITINCKHRVGGPLLRHASALLESAQYYETIGRWHLWLMSIMPDHVHFVATFDLSQGLRNTISAWKRYQTKTLGIEWQPDFFEHRLRNDSEFDEKAAYIRMNPVRKGLVENPEDWPHVLDRISIDGGSAGGVALPKIYEPNGRASSPNEPKNRNDGSAGGVALPKPPEATGGANSPSEPCI
jgi:REP element-mobilizing transposase RayT